MRKNWAGIYIVGDETGQIKRASHHRDETSPLTRTPGAKIDDDDAQAFTTIHWSSLGMVEVFIAMLDGLLIWT